MTSLHFIKSNTRHFDTFFNQIIAISCAATSSRQASRNTSQIVHRARPDGLCLYNLMQSEGLTQNSYNKKEQEKTKQYKLLKNKRICKRYTRDKDRFITMVTWGRETLSTPA